MATFDLRGPGGQARAPPNNDAAHHHAQQHTTEEEWDFEDWDEGFYAAGGNRGLTHGYARSTVDKSRALVVGCNYPWEEGGYRLRGACRDAHEWAKALRDRLGVPESKVTGLVLAFISVFW